MSLPFSTNPMTLAENIRKLDGSVQNIDAIISSIPVDKIPKDYSTTETATGLKWIDGEDIYSITVYDDLPEITQSTNITLATIATGLNVVNMEAMLYTSAGVAYNPPVNYYYSPVSGTVLFLGVSTSFSNGKGKATLYYTKPTAPSKSPDDEPETAATKAPKKKATH